MSADSLVAALVDHLRNLLIIRTCGADSELVEVPGIAIKDLAAQAEKFDAVNLTQDVTILEELRRHMRQSQSGRALLDASLVRLTLAEQFTPVAEVLARVGGVASGSGDGAQKKNNDSARVNSLNSGTGGPPVKKQNTVVPPMAHVARSTGDMPTPAGDGVRENQRETSAGEGMAPYKANAPVETRSSRFAESSEFLESEESASTGGGVESVVQAFSAAPVVSASPALEFNDDDDDLPAPGKVWDDSGPSLSELMKLEAAKAELASNVEKISPAEKQPDEFANVEVVKSEDLGAMWKSLLEVMAGHGPGIGPLLAAGTFRGVQDGQAVIAYSQKNATFTKLLDRNGKKELVRDELSKLLGQTVGVRFIVDEADPDSAPPEEQAPPRPPQPKEPMPARPQNQLRATPVVAETPSAPSIRITPELVEQIRQDALLAMVMDKFNASVVKVE
jgi:hypothetical protein